jgi:ATP-dependent Clp protease ATP-binding subunit ClpA
MVFEKFTANARDVIVCSQGEARALMHSYIGTEHLLLGLLRVEIGVASKALQSLNITLVGARLAVAEIAPPGEEVASGQIPFTPRSKKVLELALRQALSHGSEVDTEHLLLGLVEENDGVGAQVLRDAGIDAKTVGDAVERTPKLDKATSRFVELVPDLRAALSEAVEAVTKAKQVAVSLEDARRAGVIDEAERLLRQMIS